MVSRFGRYELLQSLGKGGMAEVYLARQRGPGGFEKRLVIKRVLPALAQDPRFLKLFFEEARLHASLSHGNLVSIFDFGRVGNDYFLAMELVDGCDLARLLQSMPDRRLPPELVAYIGGELCHALQHVHRHRLVHGDLTPRNVLVSVDGEVKLADFGVARGAAVAGGVRGTRAYMPPEQARGEVIDARADLYSLGVVVAESATGQRPSPEHAADTSSPFAALVERATSLDVSARYADVGAMAAAFDGLATELTSSRALAARQLAALVLAARVTSITPADAAYVPPPDAEASYFRDSTTAASFVDEMLVAPRPQPSPVRRRLWPLVALPLLGVALTLGWLTWHPHTSAMPTTAGKATPPPVRSAPQIASPVLTVPLVEEAPVRRIREETGELEVVCLPWCIVEVDGRKRTADGRLHRLRLEVGRHHIVATRLDDLQTKVVEVDARTRSIRFEFD
ncbi:MAG: serine/threonine-protein kinase [Polyangia bacterium]